MGAGCRRRSSGCSSCGSRGLHTMLQAPLLMQGLRLKNERITWNTKDADYAF